MRHHLLSFLISATLALPAASADYKNVRLCVSAGSLFPETREGLHGAVTRLLDEAQAPEIADPLYACLVPHGPYGISGRIAAQAFKHIKPGQFKRVIVLGASHAQIEFEDCSLAAVDAYATPLDFVPLDQIAIRKLTYSPLFNTRSMRYTHQQRGFLSTSERRPLHEYEHSIEMVLPFLQERLGEFTLIPILVGRLYNPELQYSAERVEDRAEAIASHIRKLMDGETLLVVSTDFVHFGNDFSYRPFDSDIFERIGRLDRAGLSRIAANDYAEFESFHRRSGEAPICGLNAIRVLLKALPRNAYGELLGHDMSGRFYNDENRSVSYASMNFYLSPNARPKVTLEPLEKEPEKAPPAPEAGEPSAPPVTLTNIKRDRAE